MSLNFKLSFDQTDFFDEDFLKDLNRIYNFYNDGIHLEYKDRILNIHESLKTNPDSLQSFMDMEREMFKEANKEKNKKK